VRAFKVSIGRRTTATPSVLLPRGWPNAFGPLELAMIDEPTPFMVIDLDTIRGAYLRLQSAFENQVEICFAVKCNPDPVVLRTLASEGANFEIASAEELNCVVEAGGDASRVLYSNTVKPAAHVARTYDGGVSLFAADSQAEILKIARQAPGAGVIVRVSVDDTHSRFPLSSKFGAPVGGAVALLRMAREHGLVPAGLTFHVGSQCTDPYAWGKAVSALTPVLIALDRLGIELEVLDIGGGFPARYDLPVPPVEEIARHTLGALNQLPYRPRRVVCEPGRALVAEAGIIAATVIGREQRLGAEWVYLDVGAYNGLMESAQTKGTWAFPLLTSRLDRSEREMRATITGPTCDASDTIFFDAAISAEIGEGDRVYIGAAGAYTLCYASSFNGFPPPTPLYFDGAVALDG
jgi:ornithine decarboxylase